MMRPGYKYHIFLSYNRSGEVGEWVHNHFYPMLRRRLESLLDEEPSIFIDEEIDIGSPWPQKLSDALNQSCHMVAIWTPSYFRSKWCMAEWRTILERESQPDFKVPENYCGLVYPVIYSNGNSFPEGAKQTQSRLDLRDYAYPYEQFSKSEKYLEFFDKITDVAKELMTRLDAVPDWSTEWRRLDSSPVLPAQPQFARL